MQTVGTVMAAPPQVPQVPEVPEVPTTPSPSLLGQLAAELRAHAPFTGTASSTIQCLLMQARQAYFAPGEVICSPSDGPPGVVWWVRRGVVQGQPGAVSAVPAQVSSGGMPGASGGFQLEAGEMFPIGAVLGQRAVTSVYRAQDDVFCLGFEAETFRRLAGADPVLADFVKGRLQHLLALSQIALQGALSAQSLAQQFLESPLASLPRRLPVAVSPQATLHEALTLMHERGVGSVLALDERGAAAGILTRHDLLPRVALASPPLDARQTRFSEVMSQPVQTLDIAQPAHQAAHLMARRGIRHVPLTDKGRVVSLVSERDLFALHIRSTRQLGAELRVAPDVATLRTLAPQLPALVRQLLAQGVAARTLTDLMSQLNDALVERVVRLLAGQHGLDLTQACWVAFGSEGRAEQTIATDQDNGLVLGDDVTEADQERWRVMGRQANEALDECGFPLCQGGIMAGEAACTQTASAWAAAFSAWMGQGQPEDLLKAGIFFDLRPIAGNAELVTPLQTVIREQAPQRPRFLRLLAANSLNFRPALNWHGGLESAMEGGRRVVDLKLHGTAVFVDAARCMALAHAVPALGTRERLLYAGQAMGVPLREAEGWAAAFEVLQMLRLRVQAGTGTQSPAGHSQDDGALRPNVMALDALNDMDRRLLRDALQVARSLQQRVEMDWVRS